MPKEYTTEDKSTWGDGPWQIEPDKVVWIDPVTSLDCMVKRGPSGALCGYVGVGPTHPLHGKDHGAIDPEVHGGLTYSDACWGDEDTGVCHIPELGRPHDVWWFGFDCAHWGDLSPRYGVKDTGTYRTLEYVKNEVANLARQLSNVRIDTCQKK